MPPPEIKDLFKIGSKVIVANDADLRGNITLNSGSVLHPKCTLLAMAGPIVLGSNCIVEENVVIVNRSKLPMIIGDSNLFQVGCRVESQTVGSWNIFGTRSRVVSSVSVGSNCNISPGTMVLPSAFPPAFPLPSPNPPPPLIVEPSSPPTPDDTTPEEAEPEEPEGGTPMDVSPPPPPAPTASQPPAPTPSPDTTRETLPDNTQVFGGTEARRRLWSGEGSGQARAFHEKHLAYLRETIPKGNRLKIFPA